MSINSVWKAKALEEQRRLALLRRTHLYLVMDIVTDENGDKLVGRHGVYCQTPALDGFDYNRVSTYVHSDFAVRGADLAPRTVRAGRSCLDHDVDCETCQHVWEPFREWAKTRIPRPDLASDVEELSEALRKGYSTEPRTLRVESLEQTLSLLRPPRRR